MEKYINKFNFRDNMNPLLHASMLATLVGCLEYELHHQTQEDSTFTDTGSSGIESTPSETYEPCNPYDAGWDIPPVGNERSDCIGIEGYAQSYAGMLNTQISYADCTVGPGLQPYWNVYESDGTNYTRNAVLLGSGQSWDCQGDFYVIAWADYAGENRNALSNLSLEAKVWMLNSEERDSLQMLSEQEEENVLHDIHEPLTYALECDQYATSLDEDCVAFLY